MKSLQIAVLGYIVRCPLGGMSWHHLQYLTGFKQLGHKVCFLEDSGDESWACYNPENGTNGTDPSCGLDYAKRVFQKIGFPDIWAYYDAFNNTWHGPMNSKAESFCKSADILINLSGSNSLRSWTEEIPVRVYLDTDPVFTQVRNLANKSSHQKTAQHNRFFTFGENIATGEHSIPDDGFPWLPTRQPVSMHLWPSTKSSPKAAFTTVMQWDNSIQSAPTLWDGKRYGRKADSFDAFFKLPRICKSRLELALGGANTPKQKLQEFGWSFKNPLEVSKDPWSYQEYIQSSKAEFSIAKEAYVSSNSGWFSERSTSYLASGRPVAIQETGFSRWLRTEGGVIPFSNLEEATEAINEIENNYCFHKTKAIKVIKEYFEAKTVLDSLIHRAL